MKQASNDNWHKVLFQAAMKAHFQKQIKKYREMAEIEACPYVRDSEPVAQETIKPEDTERGSVREEFPEAQPPKEPRRFAESKEDLAKQILRDARERKARKIE
jgi:hypothetical protein